jgi:hypothetical protein
MIAFAKLANNFQISKNNLQLCTCFMATVPFRNNLRSKKFGGNRKNDYLCTRISKTMAVP